MCLQSNYPNQEITQAFSPPVPLNYKKKGGGGKNGTIVINDQTTLVTHGFEKKHTFKTNLDNILFVPCISYS